MRKLFIRLFTIIFVGLLIMCGFVMRDLNQALTDLDTSLDNLSQSLTELELVMGIAPEDKEENDE